MEEREHKLSELDDYLHKDLIVKQFPQFTKNQLIWLEVNRDRYHLSHAIKRVGKKLYFHMPSFIEWLGKQNA